MLSEPAACREPHFVRIGLRLSQRPSVVFQQPRLHERPPGAARRELGRPL